MSGGVSLFSGVFLNQQIPLFYRILLPSKYTLYFTYFVSEKNPLVKSKKKVENTILHIHILIWMDIMDIISLMHYKCKHQ